MLFLWVHPTSYRALMSLSWPQWAGGLGRTYRSNSLALPRFSPTSFVHSAMTWKCRCNNSAATIAPVEYGSTTTTQHSWAVECRSNTATLKQLGYIIDLKFSATMGIVYCCFDVLMLCLFVCSFVRSNRFQHEDWSNYRVGSTFVCFFWLAFIWLYCHTFRILLYHMSH